MYRFKDRHNLDNSNSVILSNGERKHKFGFGETLGMWFSATLDSFLPTLSFSQSFQLVIRESHKTILHHSSGYKELFLPQEVLREVTREASGMKRCCWRPPLQLSFPRPLNGFLPHYPSLGIFGITTRYSMKDSMRNKSGMLLTYRKNTGLSL